LTVAFSGGIAGRYQSYEVVLEISFRHLDYINYNSREKEERKYDES